MKPVTTGCHGLATRTGSVTVHAGFPILTLLPRLAAALVATLIALAACAAVSPTTAETAWPEIARRVTEYAAKPSPATAKAALNVIPAVSVSFTGSQEERDALEAIYATGPIQTMEQRVLMKERESVELVFRMRHIADGAFLEDLDIILGGLIRVDAELFLTELQRAKPPLRDIGGLVRNLGDTFVDQMERKCEELRLRSQALGKVSRPSLKQAKDQALSALAADVSSCQDTQQKK